EVLARTGDPARAAPVAAVLLERGDVAQLETRRASSLNWRQTVGHALGDKLIEVKLELAVEVAAAAPARRERPKPQTRNPKQPRERHDGPQAFLSTRPTAEDSRFQLSSSRSSC